MRPKEIHLTGYDLDGNEVSVEADELVARLFQHELDHLDGVLLQRLDDDQRKEALRTLREITLGERPPGDRLQLRDQAAAAFPAAGIPRHPEVAVPLRALVDAGFDIPLVVTRPDKRRRRRGDAELAPSERRRSTSACRSATTSTTSSTRMCRSPRWWPSAA